MITILHGDNIEASRNELTRLKELGKGKEIRDIPGKHIDEAALRQAIESSSLFGDTLLVIIEQCFSSLGKKQKEAKKLAEIISEKGNSNDIILWEPKELGKTVLNYFTHATVRLFKTPAIIFELLDGIKPKNTPALMIISEKLFEKEPPELIMYMMASRIRQLIAIKDGITIGRMSPWQASRLTNQAKLFTMDKLLNMHEQLLNLEYSFKTGQTPLTLPQLITKFFIDI